MKHLFTTLFVAALLMAGCGGNKSNDNAATGSTATTETPADDQQDSLRHTPEYISQRIDTIYKYKDDSRFCSASYLLLDAQAEKLGGEMGHLCRDYDHWVVGQDTDPQWGYKIKEIKNITDSTAEVDLIVRNFKNRHVALTLVYERGDWYVDDFHISFDGKSVDNESEKDDMLTCIYSCHNAKLDKKYGQSFDITKYLDAMVSTLDVGDEVIFDRYALVDVDLDGKYEVLVHSLDDFYEAVFSLANGKPELLICTDPFTSLDYFEHAIASQGGCGTGCAHGVFCLIKDSRPVCRTAWMDQYNMKGDRIDSESGYSVNDKACDEATYQKTMSGIGRYVTFEPIWHPIDMVNRRALSDYAE